MSIPCYLLSSSSSCSSESVSFSSDISRSLGLMYILAVIIVWPPMSLSHFPEKVEMAAIFGPKQRLRCTVEQVTVGMRAPAKDCRMNSNKSSVGGRNVGGVT